MFNFGIFKRLRHAQEGNALIEMAFILPLFVLATLAIFEFAIIFFYSFVLESAMYNVTRFVKVQSSPQAVQQDVRDKINELSFGLMRDDQIIITTDLDINFAEDWENADAEICKEADGTTNSPTENCRNNLGQCQQNGFEDLNQDGLCNIGPPPLDLQAPGAIVSYVAFYKKYLFTPMLNTFLAEPNQQYYLISSGTIIRNEPQ